MRRALVALSSLALGCAATPPMEPAPVVAPAPRVLPAVMVTLSKAKMPKAPWLEATLRDSPAHPLSEVSLVAVGKKTAILSSKAGRFAVADDRIIGPLAFPADALWVALDGSDRVLVASRDGTLLAAADARAAETGAFAKKGQVPGALLWDASARHVIAATDSKVHVSSDAGVTYRVLKTEPGRAPVGVFALGDGAVAALLESTTAVAKRTLWISKDGVAPFVESDAKVGSVVRAGGALVTTEPCWLARVAGGKSWVPPIAALEQTWTHALDIRQVRAIGAAPFTPTLLTDAGPAGPPGQPAPCAPKAERAKVRTARTVPDAVKCARLACLEGSTEVDQEGIRTEIGLFSDAAGSVALVDREKQSVRVLTPPCRASRVFSVPGAGVLLCAPEGGRAAMHLVLPNGETKPEGSTTLDPETVAGVAAAADGTLVLRALWGSSDKRRALVRSPSAAGDAAAWREIELGRALEIRVAPGGGLLSIEPDDPSSQVPVLTVSLDRPGEPRQTVASRIALSGDLVDVSLDGEILVLWLVPAIQRGKVPPGTPAARGAAVPHVILSDGRVIAR